MAWVPEGLGLGWTSPNLGKALIQLCKGISDHSCPCLLSYAFKKTPKLCITLEWGIAIPSKVRYGIPQICRRQRRSQWPKHPHLLGLGKIESETILPDLNLYHLLAWGQKLSLTWLAWIQKINGYEQHAYDTELQTGRWPHPVVSCKC